MKKKKCVGEYSLLCIQTPGSTSPWDFFVITGTQESRIISSKHPTTPQMLPQKQWETVKLSSWRVSIFASMSTPQQGSRPFCLLPCPRPRPKFLSALQCPTTRGGLTTKATVSSQSSVQQNQCLLEATSPGLELLSYSSSRSFMV